MEQTAHNHPFSHPLMVEQLGGTAVRLAVSIEIWLDRLMEAPSLDVLFSATN